MTNDLGIQISVVMPCLNESETLAFCIEECLSTFKRAGLTGEVVIGDNGSTDGSQRIAMERGARVVDVSLRGYGAALLAGFHEARGDMIVMGDSDGSYDFTDIPRFLNKLNDGFDLVIGNRFQGGIEPGAMPFLNKYLGNPALSTIGRLLFFTGIRDFHCGIRAFRRSQLLALNLECTGMEFASEIIIKGLLGGLRVGQIPVRLRKDGRTRPPHLRPWRDGWRHLVYMTKARISRNKVRRMDASHIAPAPKRVVDDSHKRNSAQVP